VLVLFSYTLDLRQERIFEKKNYEILLLANGNRNKIKAANHCQRDREKIVAVLNFSMFMKHPIEYKISRSEFLCWSKNSSEFLPLKVIFHVINI